MASHDGRKAKERKGGRKASGDVGLGRITPLCVPFFRQTKGDLVPTSVDHGANKPRLSSLYRDRSQDEHIERFQNETHVTRT